VNIGLALEPAPALTGCGHGCDALAFTSEIVSMKIVITGGCGFLGQRVARELLKRGRVNDASGRPQPIRELVLVDIARPLNGLSDAAVRYSVGDAASAKFIAETLEDDTDGIFHLAAVVSGAAEANFDLGMRVNTDGTRSLLDACRRLPKPPRVLFASSVAVFGAPLPEVVTDGTTPIPQSSYGIQKLIGELLVSEYSRKGFIDGRSVRLPTVSIRPGKPNAAASSFASGILREPLNGVEAICPVLRISITPCCSPIMVLWSQEVRSLPLVLRSKNWRKPPGCICCCTVTQLAFSHPSRSRSCTRYFLPDPTERCD
jgi:D-erythronate 2-dehydrogenase